MVSAMNSDNKNTFIDGFSALTALFSEFEKNICRKKCPMNADHTQYHHHHFIIATTAIQSTSATLRHRYTHTLSFKFISI